MTTLSPDTHPDIERLQIEGLRRMPTWRKLQLAAEMGRAVRSLALAGLRQRFPDDTPAQRRRRLADLLLGSELAARVYGPLQESRRASNRTTASDSGASTKGDHDAYSLDKSSPRPV